MGGPSTALASELPFLAYDVFALSAEARMPYEGFSRSLITELDEYRSVHHLQKPDYEELRSILDEAESTESETSEELWSESEDGDLDIAVAGMAAVALIEAQENDSDSVMAEES